MTDVTITAAIRSTLQSLQGTQTRLEGTQLRLSTGKKVNSALDNANAFFASQSLSFRAGDLARLMDGMGQAAQVLKAADHGITALTSLVTQAKAIAQEVRDQAASRQDVEYLSGDLPIGATFPVGLSILIVTSPPASQAISALSGNTTAQVATYINNHIGQPFVASVVPGTVAGTERLQIKTNGNVPLVVNWGTGSAYLNVSHAPVGGSGGTDGAGTPYTLGNQIVISQPTFPGASQGAFDTLIQQINQIVQDTGYRGTNLLNGDTLVPKFNESGSSTLPVRGVVFNAAGLGLTTTSLATIPSVDEVLQQTTAALNTLRVQAKTFGSSLSVLEERTNFTAITINNLKEGSDKLTLADTNEEGANLLSLQTSQQLGITALSLAAQAAQAVLRLFS